MSRDFIVTQEHRRFTEFAGAIRKDVTIGICHGEAGVGKTQSARRYTHRETLEPFLQDWGPHSDADVKHYAAAHRSRTVFYAPEVLPKHRDLMRVIEFYRTKVGVRVCKHLCETGKIMTTVVPRTIDFTELVIIDEAERLTPTALELLWDLQDRHHIAPMFIGMTGVEQRFRHYPQLYSRLGFSHRYRTLAPEELLFVLTRHWKCLGRNLGPEDFTGAQAIAANERVTRGNFRLLERLFPQIGRVLKVNGLDTITDDVIETAASTLVTG